MAANEDAVKVRVNAVILRAFQKGDPEGFAESFQKGLDAASDHRHHIHNGKVAVHTEKALKLREQKFQTMLDELRGELAKSLHELPQTVGDKGDLIAQTNALRSIQKAAAGFTDGRGTQIVKAAKRAIDAEHALVAQTPPESPAVKKLMAEFVAKYTALNDSIAAGQNVDEIGKPISLAQISTATTVRGA